MSLSSRKTISKAYSVIPLLLSQKPWMKPESDSDRKILEVYNGIM